MRKLLVYLVMVLLCACEVIDEAERLIPVETEPHGNRTHVLIEYTGFRCVNCPTAAEQANELKKLYKEHLVIVSLHPASNPFTQGKYDYTCPAADSVYHWMDGTATTPFPTGNVNLQPRNDRWFFDSSEWPALVTQAMEDSICPPLSCSAELDTTTRNISIVIETQPDMRIAFWLVEDSVQGAQAMPNGTVDLQYYHRHVLRSVAYDCPWGIEADGQLSVTHMALPEQCTPEHCSIVALYLDKNDYHILNAYETKLDYPVGTSSMDD